MRNPDRGPQAVLRPDSRPPAVLLSDGDLPALVALALLTDRPAGEVQVAAYDPTRLLGVARTEAVRRQASLFERHPVVLRADDPVTAERESLAIELVRATSAAVRVGFGIVVWPQLASRDAEGGVELDDAAGLMDRALLASRLVGLDAGAGRLGDVSIQLPLVDLEDWQIADLAVDMGVSVQASWWWHERGQEADACRARWLGALEGVGWSVSRGPARAAG